MLYYNQLPFSAAVIRIIIQQLRAVVSSDDCCWRCSVVQTNPTWGGSFECCFKAQSAKLQRLLLLKQGLLSLKQLTQGLFWQTRRPLLAKETVELWALSFRKCHPKWDWLYHQLPLRAVAVLQSIAIFSSSHQNCNTATASSYLFWWLLLKMQWPAYVCACLDRSCCITINCHLQQQSSELLKMLCVQSIASSSSCCITINFHV